MMRGYVLGFAAYLTIGAATILAGAAAFTFRSGELISVQEAADRQNSTTVDTGPVGTLYGSALQPNTFQYKLALLNRRQPSIVALGSSRVLTFRQRFFRPPFANLGGNMNDPLEGEQLIDAMLARHKPEIAIINIDFWWFNPEYPYPRSFPNHDLDGRNLRSEDYLLLASWLFSGRFSPTDLVQTLLDPARALNARPPGIGIRARFNGEGFAPDGASFDFNLMRGERPAWDRNFIQALSRIRDGANSTDYRYGSGFAEAAWNDFRAVTERLTAAGVRTVVIVPPIARAVYRELEAHREKYPHLWTMLERLESLPVPVFDFSNLDVLGGNDCEFVDAHHVGDVGALRMALILSQDPRSPLAGTVDEAWARTTLLASSGRAFLRDDIVGLFRRETDFLNLGCPKP